MAPHSQGVVLAAFATCAAVSALLGGCGSRADANASAEVSSDGPVLDPSDTLSETFPSDSLSDRRPVSERVPLDLPPLDTAAPAACGESFQACGGLLTGVWGVEGACDQGAPDAGVLQMRALSFMGLDAERCRDALRGVKSYWSGSLTFDGHDFIDGRLRTDSMELTLSRACLNATFDVELRAEKLGTACATLSSASMSCGAAGDACQCQARHEERLTGGGAYGVFGTQVVIAPQQPPLLANYCVQGDLLQWQELDSHQHLLLRRLSAPPGDAAPPR